MSELPRGWVEVPLEEIVEILDSRRVPVNSDERQARIAGKRHTDLVPYYGATGPVGFIDEYIFDEELVLLGEDGVPFLDPLKHKAYRISGRSWVNNHAHVLRARAGVSQNRYVEHLLNRFDYTGIVSGSTRLKLTQSAMRSMLVRLAPISEQKRIADKLDTLLARVDATRARLDRIPELLKRFRQSVLAAATSGQLTEDWRQEQQSKASAQSIAPVHHGSGSDLPPPKGRVGTITWEWVETDIQSVAAVGTGSTPLRSNIAYFSKTGTPWITSSATSQRLVKVSEEYVTDEAIRAHRLKVYPKGTLLIAMYGEGKTRGQVTELGIPATINQACAAIIVDENKAIKSYVKLALQANYLEMRDMAEGGNQPNLNLSKIKEFPLSLPSINEQIEIVRRVEMIFGFVEELQEKYASAHFKIERLVPALLAKAFRGELVPQDPNDEPAEQLLARIQESRDAAPPTSKRGRKKI